MAEVFFWLEWARSRQEVTNETEKNLCEGASGEGECVLTMAGIEEAARTDPV